MCNITYIGVHLLLCHVRVHIWLHLGHVEVQICVLSFLVGNKYKCKDWNALLDEICPKMRVRSAQRDCRVCTHICSLPENIVVIFRPFCNQDCTHIWTSTWPRCSHTWNLTWQSSKWTVHCGPPIQLILHIYF